MVSLWLCGPATGVPETAPHPPIPIPFRLKEPGFVTLVIEDAQGNRVRNLLSETAFPAGQNIAWWDGLDDLTPESRAVAEEELRRRYLTARIKTISGMRTEFGVTYWNVGNESLNEGLTKFLRMLKDQKTTLKKTRIENGTEAKFSKLTNKEFPGR